MCSYHVWVRPKDIEQAEYYILVDALELNTISNAYAPAQPLELGLACPGHQSNLFLDQTPVVTVRLYNDGTEGSALVQIRAWDYFNKLAYSNQMALTAAAGLTSTNVTLASLTNWGSYRVEAWLDGVPQSIDELNVTHLPEPYAMNIDTNGNFGSHIPFDEYWLELHQKLGYKWNRTLSTGGQFNWIEVEKSPENYTYFDADLARAKQYGFSVLATMLSGRSWGNIPAWYKWSGPWTVVTFNDNDPAPDTITKQGGPAFSDKLKPNDIVMAADWWWTSSGWDTRTWTNNGVYRITAVDSNSITLASTNNVVGGLLATNLQIAVLDSASGTNRGWTAFVQAMADHYGTPGQTNTVTYWEPVNEPDSETDLDHCPAGTAYIISSAYDRFKAVNSNCVVVGLCAWSPTYIEKVVQYCGTNCFDVLSSHFYPVGEMTSGYQGNAVYGLITSCLIPYGKQGWSTESGARSRSFYQTLLWEDQRPGGGMAKFDPEIARDHKQKTDRMMQNLFVSMGIAEGGFSYEKYFNYDSRNTQAPQLLNAYSIIEYDGTVRPRGVAQAIAAHFIDYYKGQGLRRLYVPGEATNVNAYLFTREGYDPFVTVHACVSNVTYTLHTSLASSNVQAYNLMGQPLDISAGIQFEMSPIYVRGIGVAGSELIDSLSISNSADSAPPNLSLVTFPTAPVTRGENATFRWFALDDLTYNFFEHGIYAWRLPGIQNDWSEWMSATNIVTGVTISTANLPGGTNIFYVKARDPAGNEATNSFQFVVIDSDKISRPSPPSNLRVR
jgi:hypothetical protein